MRKSQSQKVREKLIRQFHLVSKKFKQNSSRELTNQDIQIALYQYSSSHPSSNEYGEKNLEWIHDRLTRLTERQMDMITLRFFKAYSLSDIAEEMMINHPETVSRELTKIYDILRG